MELILIVVVICILCGGGWGYRSGAITGIGSPLGLILLILLICVIFGGFVGPRMGYYHY